MRLNSKIGLILVVPMIALLGAFALAIQVQVLDRFSKLEHAELTQNHERLLQAIAAEFESLEQLTRDWGIYDETFSYMAGENPEFIEANFTPATFDNLQLDGIVLLDTRQQIRNEFGYDPAGHRFKPMSAGLLNRIAAAVGQRPADGVRHGIIQFEGRVVQLAISAIQDSDAEQDSRGALVMFRYLDQGTVDQLARRIKLALRFMPLRGPGSKDVPADALEALRRRELWQRVDSPERVSSFSYLRDLAGEPTLLMQVSMPRDIYREGQTTVRQLFGFTAVAMVLFVLATFLAIRQVALKRLSRMSRRLIQLGAESSGGERLSTAGNDEISRVATSVNAMLDGLDRAYEQRRRAAERQRELNALLVRIATDESLAEGDSDALFRVLGGSLAAGAALDRWSLWLSDEDAETLECLRMSGEPGAAELDGDRLQRELAAHRGEGDALRLQFSADGEHHGVILPFEVGDRHGALCVEAFDRNALQQPDEINFLISATQLIERSLAAHFQSQREQLLRQRAEYDTLTGLANRSMFERELRRALAGLADGRTVGLLFVDLDCFKPVNDTYGHAVGDWLLCRVAERLRDRVRSEDLVARLGGDEFTVVLRALKDPADAGVVAGKLVAALREPFQHDSGPLQIGCSIGVALAPCHGSSFEELMEAADRAMYRTKQAGRDGWSSADGHPAALAR